MKLAKIVNGIVENVIEVDARRIPAWSSGWPEVSNDVEPGWVHDEDQFSPPVRNREKWRSTASVSFPELIIGLKNLGWIDINQARAWLSRNDLPEIVWQIVNTLPDDGTKFEAEAIMLGMREADRLNPMVSYLSEMKRQSMPEPKPTPEEMEEMVDELFKWSQVESP